ncbi:MAG: translation initiation factor IF-3 [Solirubrobacteraceae bacterium]
MPGSRKFDRRPPERDLTRINDRIRVPEVRLVGDDGNQIGVMKTPDALAYAQERDLDLVEVAPEARPPVCRVLDYSKYKYEQAQKVKAAKKHQQQITIREIKFRPKIAQADYDTKKGHVTRFLKHKDKVKVTIMFRGREVTHPERGTMLLERLAEELAELAIVEQRPLQDGRNMTMMLGPSKAVLADALDKPPETEGDAAEAPEAVAEEVPAEVPEVTAEPEGEIPEVTAEPEAEVPEVTAEPVAEVPEVTAEPVAPEPEPEPVAEEPAAEPVAKKTPKPAAKATKAAAKPKKRATKAAPKPAEPEPAA